MLLLEQIDSLIINAMKEGQKDILSIARVVKSDLLANYKSEKPKAEVDVLKSKKLLEELDTFKHDAVKSVVLKFQLEWLEQFLPQMVTEEELKAYWDTMDSSVLWNIGSIMKQLKSQFGDRLDGKLASEFAKQVLSKN